MESKITYVMKASCYAFAANPVTGNIEWMDKTIYPKREAERLPTSFVTKVGACRISISFGTSKTAFFLYCSELGFIVLKPLKAKTAHEAAEEALKVCGSRINELYTNFISAGLGGLL